MPPLCFCLVWSIAEEWKVVGFKAFREVGYVRVSISPSHWKTILTPSPWLDEALKLSGTRPWWTGCGRPTHLISLHCVTKCFLRQQLEREFLLGTSRIDPARKKWYWLFCFVVSPQKLTPYFPNLGNKDGLRGCGLGGWHTSWFYNRSKRTFGASSTKDSQSESRTTKKKLLLDYYWPTGRSHHSHHRMCHNLKFDARCDLLVLSAIKNT